MRRHSIVGAVVALTVLLAGCATEPPAEITEPAPIVTETPTPTPTQEPTKPALDELVLTTEGLGYLVIGQPVPSIDPSLAIVEWVDGWCQAGVADDQPYTGAWQPAYDTEHAFVIDGTSDGLRDGSLTMIWLAKPGIESDAGLSVGDSLADLTSAYASFDQRAAVYQSEVYVIDGTAGRLVYEVYEGAIASISSIPAGTEPRTNAGSDAGFPCA